MEKLKVMVVVGTRPEIIRLSEVIKAIDKYFNLVLVHTGQNYDYTLNEIFFKEFGLRKPDYYLDAPGKHLGETVGNIISKTYSDIKIACAIEKNLIKNELFYLNDLFDFYFLFSFLVFLRCKGNQYFPIPPRKMLSFLTKTPLKYKIDKNTPLT